MTIEEQIEHIQKTQGLLVDENLEKIGPKVRVQCLRWLLRNENSALARFMKVTRFCSSEDCS